MRKILLISIIVTVAIFGNSCKKKDSVEFSQKKYGLHYDETIKLNVERTDGDLTGFYFTSQDTNVVKVDDNGYASGVFIGTTTVTVSNGELTDKCNIEVVPYENIYITPLLNLSLLTKEQMKLAENRNLKSESENELCYYPFESESGIDSLKYTFIDDNEVLMTVYIKENITDDSISLFLKERYRKNEDVYVDHNTDAIIRYEAKLEGENAKLVYDFKE